MINAAYYELWRAFDIYRGCVSDKHQRLVRFFIELKSEWFRLYCLGPMINFYKIMLLIPSFLGFVYDQTQSYNIAFYIAGCTSAFGAVILLLLAIFDRQNTLPILSAVSTPCWKGSSNMAKSNSSNESSENSTRKESIASEKEIKFFLSRETNV